MADRTATPSRTTGKQPPRRSLTERLQDTMSNAAQEHRANAETGAGRGRRASRAPGRQPRRARLRLTRIDPWSVMKTSFLLSVAFGVVSFVEGDSGNSTFDVTDYVGMSRVLGFTLLVSVLDVVLLTAIATLTAFLYNLAAALLGGIEVTLAEDEK